MLKFLLPVGEAKAEASLIRTLTQYGLNASKFCTEFNQKSLESFPKGLLVVVKVKVNFENKTFALSISNVSMRFLVQSLDEITLVTLFDLYRILFLINLKSNRYLDIFTFFSMLGSLKRFRMLRRKLKV